MKPADLQGTTLLGFHGNEYHGTGGILQVCPAKAKNPFQRNWGLPANIVIDSIVFKLWII